MPVRPRFPRTLCRRVRRVEAIHEEPCRIGATPGRVQALCPWITGKHTAGSIGSKQTMKIRTDTGLTPGNIQTLSS